MSSSVQSSEARPVLPQHSGALLGRADEDICPYLVRAEARQSLFMPQEIEIKFRVDDVRELTRRLRAAKFRQVTRRTHETNTLYDLPGQPLRKRCELLRLRKYGNGWLLTHKARGKAARHKTRVETQTEIDDGEQFAVSQATLTTASGGGGTGDLPRIPLLWAWKFLNVDGVWQWLRQRVEPSDRQGYGHLRAPRTAVEP